MINKEQWLESKVRIWALIKRELSQTLYSPISYIVVALFLSFTSWHFFSLFFLSQRIDMMPFVGVIPIIYSILIPAITMRSFSEEIYSGSFEMLMTLPIKIWEVVAGKILSNIIFIIFMTLPTLLYPIIISLYGDVNPGIIFLEYIGIFMVIFVYGAIGVYASSISRNQITAWTIGASISIFLWVCGQMAILLPVKIGYIFSSISISNHLNNLSRGILDFRDILYFFSIITLFIYLTYKSIEGRVK